MTLEVTDTPSALRFLISLSSTDLGRCCNALRLGPEDVAEQVDTLDVGSCASTAPKNPPALRQPARPRTNAEVEMRQVLPPRPHPHLA